ncbi:nucleotidyltransferase family protein [Clostridium butyricum]|uniref:nucleotidyltransferase family protein n=1 Tax=Clostridium butyricum TaxID=1492 RepID=UPI0018AC60F1|nr:nucleotidyltransferase family protein [Clostridium butyricum]MDB2155082.1 nucleotidyltransferase family protein [Clostridium butyricum]
MKINLILLASGFSRRFNGNKLLTELNDKPLYMYIVDTVREIISHKHLSSTYINKIICVTQYEEIEDNLKDTNINVLINNNSDLGVSNSIKLGISYDMNADGYMFIVCDQPLIKKETLEKILERFKETNKGIVALGMRKQVENHDICNKDNLADKSYVIGNPVIFSKNYISELLSLKGDIGGKRILKKHIEDVELVYADNEIELMDIDTLDSYKEIKKVLETYEIYEN